MGVACGVEDGETVEEEESPMMGVMEDTRGVQQGEAIREGGTS